jgi:hypothetical protein
MKNEKCVALFKSIHEVLKVEEILQKEDIYCDIIPLPRNISKSCGMGVVFICNDLKKIKDKSAENNIEPQYFYRLQEGQFQIMP